MLDHATRARMRLTPALERAIERLCGHLLDIPDALRDLPLTTAKRPFHLLRRNRNKTEGEEHLPLETAAKPPFAST